MQQRGNSQSWRAWAYCLTEGAMQELMLRPKALQALWMFVGIYMDPSSEWSCKIEFLHHVRFKSSDYRLARPRHDLKIV